MNGNELRIGINPSIISEALHSLRNTTDGHGDCALPPWKQSVLDDAIAKIDPLVTACQTATEDDAHDLIGLITLRKVVY